MNRLLLLLSNLRCLNIVSYKCSFLIHQILTSILPLLLRNYGLICIYWNENLQLHYFTQDEMLMRRLMFWYYLNYILISNYVNFLCKFLFFNLIVQVNNYIQIFLFSFKQIVNLIHHQKEMNLLLYLINVAKLCLNFKILSMNYCNVVKTIFILLKLNCFSLIIFQRKFFKLLTQFRYSNILKSTFN